MKKIIALEHVTGNIYKFEKFLKEAVNSMQDQGLSVEISHAAEGEFYSAVVVGYKQDKD